jgi:hypothetical protein
VFWRSINGKKSNGSIQPFGILIMAPKEEEDTEKDNTLTVTTDSLLKNVLKLEQLIEEANRTISALVEANNDSNRTLLNVVGRLEQITNENNRTLADRLMSDIKALMEANRDLNRTLLNSVAVAILKSVATRENQGFWHKLYKKRWEKMFDLVVDVIVAIVVGFAVGMTVAVVIFFSSLFVFSLSNFFIYMC